VVVPLDDIIEPFLEHEIERGAESIQELDGGRVGLVRAHLIEIEVVLLD
jgi:hypothetical protein